MPENSEVQHVEQVAAVERSRFDRLRRAVVATTIAGLGVIAGLMAAPDTDLDVGPIKAAIGFDKELSLAGGTEADLTALRADVPTHRGIGITGRLTGIDPSKFNGQVSPEDTMDEFKSETVHAVTELQLKGLATILGFTLGAAGVSYLAESDKRHRIKQAALTGAIGAGLGLTLMAGLPLLSRDESAFEHITYTGPLSDLDLGPQDIQDLFQKYGQSSAGVLETADYLNKLRLSILKGGDIPDDAVGMLVGGDIHCVRETYDLIKSVKDSDPRLKLYLDDGDLTDHSFDLWNRFGINDAEDSYCLDGIDELGMPAIVTRGNHDPGSTMDYIRSLKNVTVLDGQSYETNGFTIYGIGDHSYTPDGSDDSAETAPLKDLPLNTDILLTHRPKTAEGYAGLVPVIISGHTHEQSIETDQGSVLINPGTGGAAGLRNFAGKEPADRTLTAIYFDPDTRQLVAARTYNFGPIGSQQLAINTCAISRQSGELEVAC